MFTGSTSIVEEGMFLKMLGFLLSAALAAPFALPTVDGKALSVSEGQTLFIVPLRFEKVRAFYASQLDAAQVTSTVKREAGGPVLTLVNRRASDSWKKAVIRESPAGTQIEVTPIIRLSEEKVTGNGKPLVEFVLGRSRAVDQAVQDIGDSHGARI